MVVTLGQQYNLGEKLTVTLYTYFNHHAEPRSIAKQANINWSMVTCQGSTRLELT